MMFVLLRWAINYKLFKSSSLLFFVYGCVQIALSNLIFGVRRRVRCQ